MLVLVHGITTMLITAQIKYEGNYKTLLEKAIAANAMFSNIVNQKRREDL